jgi:putative ABC transport system permease protein
MARAAPRVPLVWANLGHYRVRTLVGTAGLTFAVILLFLQLGFLGSAEANATLVYDQLDFDLLLLSSDYVEFNQPGTFAPERLARLRQHRAVVSASPLYLTFQFWRKDRGVPALSETLEKRRLLALAFDPGQPVFRLPEIRDRADRLKLSGNVLWDRRSRPEFEVPDGVEDASPPVAYRLGPLGVRVVGQFSLGAGFLSDGLVILGQPTYARLVGPVAADGVQFGLLKLRENADPEAVAGDLNRDLGPDVYVWTRDAIGRREKSYWVNSTSIGIIFLCGVIVSVLVGVVFVYQVISSDITSRLKEFATLKAMGYSDRYLAGTVLHQAVLLALFGYLPGLAAALALYAVAAVAAGIPIGIPGEPVAVVVLRCLGVLVITIGLCSLSGVFALNKLKTADPADLF